MKEKCSLDVESFSRCDLKRHGLFRYAEDPSTEILVICYAFDDEPVQTWVPGRDGDLPHDLVDHIQSGGVVSAFNYQFERTVLNGVAGKKIHFPILSIEQGRCSMAKVRVAGLPGSLGDAAAAMGTSAKQTGSTNTMRQLSKPRTGAIDRYTPENSPEKFEELYAYCAADVEAERALDRAVPDLTDAELQIWRLDQAINERGLAVDMPRVEDALALIEEYKTQLETEFTGICGLAPTQNAKLAVWVREHGYPQLPDLQAETVRSVIKDPNCPSDVAKLLRIYSSYNAKAVSKYKSLKNMVCKDGRIHGMFMFYGASTGRWSSTGVQLQNIARGSISDPDTAIELMKDRDLDWMKAMYAGVDFMKVMGSCVRGMLVPAAGHDILAIDFAGIESRITAWIAGEEWKLRAFEDYDAGTGPDTYMLAYAKAFNVEVESVTKYQRQIGKVMELALGYEGGVGAFTTMTGTYGINLDELVEAAEPVLPWDALESANWMFNNGYLRSHELPKRTVIVIDALKTAWRNAHPRIACKKSGVWFNLKMAALGAISYPGSVYMLPNKLIKFKVEDRWLVMRLPSGRKLRYFNPSIDSEGAIRYEGIETESRRWMRCATYGGKIMQNAAEGIARDLLTDGMMKIDAAGFPVIGSVHDEGIAEPRTGYSSLDEVKAMFLDKGAWAKGLPLAAEGFRSSRYRK